MLIYISEGRKPIMTGVGAVRARGRGSRRARSAGFYAGRGGCRAEGGGQAPDDGSDSDEPGLQPEPQHLHAQAGPGIDDRIRRHFWLVTECSSFGAYILVP